MALRITDERVVCDACVPECPNNAIFEPGVDWAVADGTGVKGPCGKKRAELFGFG